MKRKWIAIAALFAALLLLSGIIAVYALQKKDAAQALKIGVSVYKSDDTFITGVMADLQREAKEYEQSTGNKLHLDLSDAAESQRLQNEQVKRYISLDYDVLLVNLVDRTNASTIIDAVASAGIPVSDGGRVKRSLLYLLPPNSSGCVPRCHAGVAVTGVRIASHVRNTSSNSRTTMVRTFAAFM